jgi:hypothetical protein
MSDWDDIWKESAREMIAALGGERVVYTPTGGRPRTILALVDRQPVATYGEEQNGIAPKMTVQVENHPTRGIDAARIGYDGDTITVAYAPGDTAQAWIVRRSPDRQGQDAAFLVLVLR